MRPLRARRKTAVLATAAALLAPIAVHIEGKVRTLAGDHANLPRSDHRNSPGMSASTAPAA
jgi:hypothetical protein